MTSLIDNIVYLYENKSRIYLEIYEKSRNHGRTVINKLIQYIIFRTRDCLSPFVQFAKILMNFKLIGNRNKEEPDEEDCQDFEIDYIDVFLTKANKLLPVYKKHIQYYLTRGLGGVVNVIICLMTKANLSPFVYFMEVLIDKNTVNQKRSYKEICKRLVKVR